jgi:VWFA-related protein
MPRLSSVVLAACLALPAPAQEPQSFPGGTEMVAVDVRVVDDDGNPVSGLAAADFAVEIDGKPRPVVSAQFVDLRETATTTPGGTAPATAPLKPAPSRPPRNVVIVVDRGSLSTGPIRFARQAVNRMLDQLEPRDRVAYLPLPSGPRVDFTTDRAAIGTALDKTGPAVFRHTGTFNVGLAEAVAIVENRSQSGGVIQRECRQFEMFNRGGTEETRRRRIEMCGEMVQREASLQVTEHKNNVRSRLQALEGIMKALGTLPGPKTVILLTGGLTSTMLMSDPDAHHLIRQIPATAAAAQVSLYTFYVPERAKAFDASINQPRHSLEADQRIKEEGLETLTGLAGGAYFELTAGAGWAFARVAREISAHYLLAIEPAPSDRDGKTHEIRVKVARSGVTLRARQKFAVPSRTGPTLSADAAPPAAPVPLHVATYRLRGRTPDEIKLMVVCEAEGLPGARYGLRLQDEAGAVLGDAIQEQASPRSEETLLVKPGNYTVKAVAADAQGRHRAVVTRAVSAAIGKVDGLATSDLVLFEREGGSLRVGGHRPVRGEALSTYVELYPLRPGLLFGGTFEVTGPDGKASTSPATFQLDTPNRLTTMEGSIDVAALAPGPYRLVARITSHGKPLTTVEGAFEVTTHAR